MKFTSPFNLTLVWAEQIHGLPGAGVWRLTFLKGVRHVEVSGELLVDVVPVGQWLLVDMSREEVPRLMTFMPLPVEVRRDDIEQQYSWLADEQHAILSDIWGMLAYLPDAALRRFYLAVLLDERIMWPSSPARRATSTIITIQVGCLSTVMRWQSQHRRSACSG